LQVSVPASFFASSSNYYLFKMQAGRYSCKNLTLEMDLTNTLAAAVQLVPAPILVDYIRISMGSGAILQNLYGEELWGYLAMSSNNKRMTGYQCITNTAPTTFQSAGTISAGATVTYRVLDLVTLCCCLSWSTWTSSLAISMALGSLFRYIHKDQASTSLGQSETSLSMPLG